LLSLAKAGKKRKTATLAISDVPKGKKIKVLTHRPRYIKTVVVPKFGEGTSSTTEARQIDLPKLPTAEQVETLKIAAEAKEKAVKKTRARKNNSATRNLESTGKSRIAEGSKGSRNNSQEKENG
jgi:hypothetical protein